MKYLILSVLFCSFSYVLKAELTLKLLNSEEKDLSCITLLELAGKKSKKEGETVKYEKLKKLQKSYIEKYEEGYFTHQKKSSQLDAHSLKIKEKGQRYINKGLQKCGLK